MDGQQISFVTLGEVLLDELHFSEKKRISNVLGGYGTHAATGARLFLPSPESRQLSFIIEGGFDFPASVEAELQTWDMTLVLRKDPEHTTTTSCIKYADTTLGPKTFEYLTPPIPILPSKLDSQSLSSACFHLLAAPDIARDHIHQIIRLRRAAGIYKKPFIIWEPEPVHCNPPGALEAHLQTSRLVDVFSPNRFELAALFCEGKSKSQNTEALETWCTSFVSRGFGSSKFGAIVVRADSQGCFLKSQSSPFTRFPAYHDHESMTENQSTENPKKSIVDTTGAGNTFLGAFSVGLIKTGDISQAASYGSVGASFALEQIGLPRLQSREDGRELWNGVSVASRLSEYLSRLHSGPDTV